MKDKTLSKILGIISLVLWLYLGIIVLINQSNKYIVLTWAATSGIFSIFIITLHMKGEGEEQ